MDFARACELVEAVNSYSFYEMGLVDRVKSFGDASLPELCQAARIVKDHPGVENADGSKTMRTFPDDRLIAAVYAMAHYKPQSMSCEVDPICKSPPTCFARNGSALVHVELEPGEG